MIYAPGEKLKILVQCCHLVAKSDHNLKKGQIEVLSHN